MKHTPTQWEIDRIAAFVEAANELRNEPFFHPDEKREVKMQGDKMYSFIFGDRFHFRSALVTFRRIWLNDEPSNFNSCCNIIWKYEPESRQGLLTSWRSQVRKITASKAFVFLPLIKDGDLSTGTLIDLWLNAVFAHVSVVKVGDTRHQFEECLKKYGQAPMEFAFRNAVWQLGLQYINMSDHEAKPFLRLCESEANIRPSFEIGAPFGIKNQEITPDGHTLIRKSSSKFFNEEPFEKMVERVSSRDRYSSLRFVVDHLEISTSEKIKALTLVDTIEEIISNAGKRVVIEEIAPGTFPSSGQGPRAFSTLFDIHTGKKSGTIIDETGLRTSQVGIDILNESLKQLKCEIRKEARDNWN